MSLNLRNEIVMATQFAEKEFRAHFPAGASYQECFDALRQFADKILEMSKAYEAEHARQAQPTTPEPSSTEVTDCPVAPFCPDDCTGQASA